LDQKKIEMKNLIAILICFGIVSFGFAQKTKGDEIPQAVTAAFAKKYPEAKSVKWEKEDGVYEASFDLHKEEISAQFDTAGNLKEVETEIETAALPAPVKNSLSKDYAGYKVKEAAKIVSENSTTYEAELKKGKESFDLIFSEDGKLLKKSEKKNEKD
jgi:hypothetical protein